MHEKGDATVNVWGTIKNTFYVVGSLAGILAWIRPAFESKHQEDMKRAAAILAKFNENGVIELPYFTCNPRQIPGWCFRPFNDVRDSIEENRQEVRFIGPLGKKLRSELEQTIRAYDVYRQYVQVPEWEPVKDAESGDFNWRFNKAAFREPQGRISDEYVRHLDAATKAAELVKLRFQRFQALTELHFFEAFAPKIFVPRKYKTAHLQLPKADPSED